MDFLNQNMHNIVLAAVILLIAIVLMVAWRKLSPRVSGGRRGQRLGVSEYYEVDKDRRLVIVRRDGVEHLILIGGPQDIVIEAGIGATPAAARAPQWPTSNPVEPGSATPPLGTARPAPRPSVYVDKPAAGPSIRREEPEL